MRLTSLVLGMYEPASRGEAILTGIIAGSLVAVLVALIGRLFIHLTSNHE
jgi:hypothetical protein